MVETAKTTHRKQVQRIRQIVAGWQKLSSKVVYKTNWFYVQEDAVINPMGQKSTYSTLEKADELICVAAIDTQNRVYLVEQFRYPVQEKTWELVAGHSDGQDIITAAKRELLDEAGLEAKTMTKLTKFYTDKSYSGSAFHLFIAQGLTTVTDKLDPVDGITDLKAFSEDEILYMLRRGELKDSHTVASLFFIFDYLRNQRA